MRTYYNILGVLPFGKNLTYQQLAVDHQWERSPRLNGVLRLRANPWRLSVVAETSTNNLTPDTPRDEALRPQFLEVLSDYRVTRARAVAASDLRGNLARKIKNRNVGALGVTIATTKQSIDMLRGSGDRIVQVLNGVQKLYATTRYGRRKLKRLRRLFSRGGLVTAGMVLEGFFGWAPLLEDARSAAATVSDPWPKGWVSSSVDWELGRVYYSRGNEFVIHENQWTARGRESYACGVLVANPNMWLANKLGLLNLPGIAWDLVPWSFLVNAVSNLGQCMGSLSDFAGLDLVDSSATHGVWTVDGASSSKRFPGRPSWLSTAAGIQQQKLRWREVGVAPPSVTPYMRFPEWNVSWAAITGALLIQQVHRLDRFLRG